MMNFQHITSPEDFDSLAAEWNALLKESISDVPFLRHEYLQAWWQTRGGGEWPQAELALIIARQDGQLKGIAPLFFTQNLDDRPALLLLGSIEISDYLDLIVRTDDIPEFLSGLLDFLASDSVPAWEVLDWYNLPEDSSTLPVLEAEARKRGLTYSQEKFRPALSVQLPGDFEQYLAGIDKKQRHEIRRKMRRADEYELPVRWYIVEDETTLDAEIDDFLELMANDPEKDAFLTDVMYTQMRASVHAAFQEGWLQLAFLAVDGKKACGYLNFDYNNRIWVYNSGLNFDYSEISPGWVLLGHLLQWANEHGRSEFDFMRGDEAYKYKFGGLDHPVLRVKITR
jgi:CelD/BcsL family acetyltransferase involved in cellulose biosynthesis